MKKVMIFLAIIIIILIVLVSVYKLNNNSKIEEATGDIAQQIVPEPKEYVEVLDNGTRKNKSSGVTEEKVVENLRISDIQLKNDGKDTYLSAKVTTTDDTQLDTKKKLKVDLIQEDGTIWISVYGIVTKTNEGTEGNINIKISGYDFTNTHDIKITIE